MPPDPPTASASDRIAKNRQFGLCRFGLFARKRKIFTSANLVQGQQCTGGLKIVKMGGLVPWRAPGKPLKIDSLHFLHLSILVAGIHRLH
jgi:hypothetical protein